MPDLHWNRWQQFMIKIIWVGKNYIFRMSKECNFTLYKYLMRKPKLHLDKCLSPKIKVIKGLIYTLVDPYISYVCHIS